MTDEKTKSLAWGFVIEHYPNYHSSDAIARNDDLHKLCDGEYEDGDGAHHLLHEDYGGDINNPQIKRDFDGSLLAIYQEAIVGFLLSKDNVGEVDSSEYFVVEHDGYKFRINRDAVATNHPIYGVYLDHAGLTQTILRDSLYGEHVRRKLVGG
jgi:hypothetical protein